MWKGILVMFAAVPLAFTAAGILWAAFDWRTGLVAGGTTFGLCLLLAIVMLLFTKHYTLGDVFLPTVFAIVWSVLLFPLSLGTSLFSAPAAIGSGLVLSACLWKAYHDQGVGRRWLILPITVFLYEMIPLNIPGAFDDYMAFGGQVTNAALLYFVSDSPTRRLTH